MHDIEVSHRIEARPHGPQHLIHIGAVDVVVHDHGPLAVVSARHAVCGDVEHVARMAGIALADLDRGEARRRRPFMIPDAENVRQAAGLQGFPNLRGAGDALEQPGFIDRLVLRRAS